MSDDVDSRASDARQRLVEWMADANAEIRLERFITARNGRNDTYHSDHTNPDAQLPADSSRLSGNYGIHFGDGLLGLDVDDVEAFHASGAADQLPLDGAFAVRSAHAKDEPTQYLFAVTDNEGIAAALSELPGGSRGKVETNGCEIAFGGMMFVGPGSQRDADKCDSGHCNGECEGPDSGWYEIANEGGGEPLSPEQLRAAFGGDGQGDLGDTGDTEAGASGSQQKTPGSGAGETTSEGGETSENGESGGSDATDAMQPCYRRALETRRDPSGANVDNQTVNSHAALLGLWAGYDAETVAEHMVADYPPEDAGYGVDKDETESQVERLEKKTKRDDPLAAPSIETLRGDGVLDGEPGDRLSDTDCIPGCPIHGNGAFDSGTTAEGLETPNSDDHGVVERNGCYGYSKSTGEGDDDWKWVEVANFQLEAESFLVDDTGEDSVELTVHPHGAGEPYTMTVSMTVFNQVREFRDKVVTQRSTAYSGGISKLNGLRKFVGNQNAPVRVGVDQIGLHGEEWVTPAGVLTADGWTDDPDHVYQRSDTPIEQQWALAPDEWPNGEFDHETVASILELLPQTREPDRFLPVLGWWYATAFRPLIMEWTGQFPILNVSGETGAGKTGTFNVLSQLFGLGTDPQAATGTTFPKLTSIGSSNAVPVWLDEYKPADMANYRVDALHNLLRKSTRGATEARGNPDGSSDLFQLRAPVCITGEQLVSGPAEERRAVQTTFSEQPSSPESDMYRHYKRLVGGAYTDTETETETERTQQADGYELQQHAVAYLQWALKRAASIETLHQWWEQAGREVAELLAEHDITGLNDDVADGFQVIRFGCMLYRRFATTMGADATSAGVSDEAIDDAIMYVARAGGGVEQLSHTERLLAVASRAAAAGGDEQYLVDGDHYRLVTPADGEGEELRFKLGTGFDQIRRYASEHSVADGDLLDSSDDYRQRVQNAADDPESVVIDSSKKTRGLSRTVAFDVERAEREIRGFERMLWTGEPDEEDGAGDEEQPTPIEDLSTGGYATLTARVNDIDRPNNSDAPTQAGRIVDETGPVDIVCWGTSPFDLAPDEHYRFSDVQVGEYDGSTQVELVDGITSVEPITPGDGHTSAAADGGGDVPDDAEGVGADADRIAAILSDAGQLYDETALKSKAAKKHDISPDSADRALAKLCQRGDVVEHPGPKYELNN